MTVIREIPQTFTNYGQTTADEYLQCRGGQVLLSFKPGEDQDRGIMLNRGEGFDIPSGKTIYLRAANGRTAWVSREEIG